jgi:hypothetical protein
MTHAQFYSCLVNTLKGYYFGMLEMTFAVMGSTP